MQHKSSPTPWPQNIVYVREISTETLPYDLRHQVGGTKNLFSLHDSDGERLALVSEQSIAFDLARENNLTPVLLH